jgi:hypothetical protein
VRTSCFLLSSNCTATVPDHLRNESGVDGKPFGKKVRKTGAVMDDFMLILSEAKKDKDDLVSALLGRFDAMAAAKHDTETAKQDTVTRFDSDESFLLFEEQNQIEVIEARITSNASMDADTKAHLLEALNHRKEVFKTKLVEFNVGTKKRKASEMSDM